jgi:hypothetical protein
MGKKCLNLSCGRDMEDGEHWILCDECNTLCCCKCLGLAFRGCLGCKGKKIEKLAKDSIELVTRLKREKNEKYIKLLREDKELVLKGMDKQRLLELRNDICEYDDKINCLEEEMKLHPLKDDYEEKVLKTFEYLKPLIGIEKKTK